MWWKKDKPYSRGKTLEIAAAARGKGRLKKAIAAYREVLEHEPDDPDTEGKLAIALAESGNLAEAWPRLRAASSRYASRGFDRKAIALLRDGSRKLPRQADLWLMVAELEMRGERPLEAVVALLEGRGHLRRRRDRRDAIRLLVRLLEIDPQHLEAILDLARLLARTRRRDDARALLESRTGREHASERRRVRWALFRLSPTPAALWRWMRATP